LSTLPRPTIAFVTPETVPVNAGLASGAFASKAVCRPVVSAIAWLWAEGGKVAGTPDRSEYRPLVATLEKDGFPVIEVQARLVTGAATEITPDPSIETFAPCLTPPRTLAVETGRV